MARVGAPLKPVRVALLGCGTVGEGVVKLLRRNAALHERKLGAPLELVGVADRSLRPTSALGLTAKLITRDAAALVARADVDIVVELFGGIEPARSLILNALESGKDVVTANKALLAEHGERIFAVAARAGRGDRLRGERRRRRADHPHASRSAGRRPPARGLRNRQRHL